MKITYDTELDKVILHPESLREQDDIDRLPENATGNFNIGFVRFFSKPKPCVKDPNNRLIRFANHIKGNTECYEVTPEQLKKIKALYYGTHLIRKECFAEKEELFNTSRMGIHKHMNTKHWNALIKEFKLKEFIIDGN